jgi:hypothetical protein
MSVYVGIDVHRKRSYQAIARRRGKKIATIAISRKFRHIHGHPRDWTVDCQLIGMLPPARQLKRSCNSTVGNVRICRRPSDLPIVRDHEKVALAHFP